MSTTPTIPTDDPRVFTRKEGVGAFGMYVAYVVYSTKTHKLLREDRFFLYNRMLVRYSRKQGEKRAAWRARMYDTAEEARKELIVEIERRNNYEDYAALQMIHPPIFIEMVESDVQSYQQKEAPYARHEGSRIVEKITGKIDDDTWVPLSEVSGGGSTPTSASGGAPIFYHTAKPVTIPHTGVYTIGAKWSAS